MGTLASRVYRYCTRQEPTEFPGTKDYWETRYAADGHSGLGSYGKIATFKAEILNAFVAQHEIRTVLEFGCGDGNQLRLARYPHYVALDISKSAIERCSRAFADDRTKPFS